MATVPISLLYMPLLYITGIMGHPRRAVWGQVQVGWQASPRPVRLPVSTPGWLREDAVVAAAMPHDVSCPGSEGLAP